MKMSYCDYIETKINPVVVLKCAENVLKVVKQTVKSSHFKLYIENHKIKKTLAALWTFYLHKHKQTEKKKIQTKKGFFGGFSTSPIIPPI